MDITTIIGIFSGIGLIVWGVLLGGDVKNFFDIPSIAIVVGGTIAAIFASFPIKTLKSVGTHMKIVLSSKRYDPEYFIETIVEFAQIARKSGLLSLEDKANDLEEPFLKDGVLLIVDAVDSQKIRNMLENDIEFMDIRHQEGISVYEKGASLAPAFGMIGTLIGLINMLSSLDLSGGSSAGDSLGQGMSTALVTTFYGSVLGNLIFTPLANKLMIRNDEEILCKQIVVEGILSIQSGENPKYIKEKLQAFLQQKQRIVQDSDNENKNSKKDKK